MVVSDVLAHLAIALQEGLAFDVAHRAAHLDDDHVGLQVASGHRVMRRFISLVTCGMTWMVPPRCRRAALRSTSADLPGRGVAGAAQILVDEAPVTAQIQVSLRHPGDEDFAVGGATWCRIDVEVWVEFLDRYRNAAFQQPANGGWWSRLCLN